MVDSICHADWHQWNRGQYIIHCWNLGWARTHGTKPGRVTIAGHPQDDLATGTLNSILRQAGLKD
ncbi:MAG: type II toxin-antitoxin system HicA family toxin [Planctomycetaceae bacterium]